MGRRLVTFAATAALLASPLAAEQATPDENLDCAVWASAIATRLEKGSNGRSALNAVFAWFLGLYEGQTGAAGDEAYKARLEALTRAEIERLNPVCAARMKAFGDRLQVIGRSVQQSGS